MQPTRCSPRPTRPRSISTDGRIGNRPGELDAMTVPQRISIVTLGVADVATATRFYESLGWRRAPGSQESITFFEMQGSALGLFGHGDLAEDAGVSADGPGSQAGTFRGVTISINVDSPSRRGRGVRRLAGLRGRRREAARARVLGWVHRLCRGSRREPVGDRPQPAHAERRRRPHHVPRRLSRHRGMANAGPPVASGPMSRSYSFVPTGAR